MIYQGDCRVVLPFLADNSVDAIVTDPPYGLGKEPDALEMLRDWLATGHHTPKSTAGFMGKAWDAFVPQPAMWAECLRVLKPGGHVLAFAGTRTQDLMALGLRIAGFEIRDLVAWVYGQGFPKSHNMEGDWQGWGTALKPALEPITLARKPLRGTVAANVTQHGTGALNIDGCRVETAENLNGGAYAASRQESASEWAKSGSLHKTTGKEFVQPVGRWPANLIHDGSDEVLAAFPAQAGGQDKRQGLTPGTGPGGFGDVGAENGSSTPNGRLYGDTGSAARFFYCAKASKADRGEGNIHPTVKPTELMRYLCRLITPPGGTVLDPFMGSGTTGKAAALEGFQFIGIELNPEYVALAKRRAA